jgi:hypothetical protein
MSDIVTGTPAVVGFTNGYGNHHGHHWHGISDKDQMFASSIDAGERTRDVISAIYNSIVATEKVGAANQLTSEKIGAAAELTAERIGAANLVATEKIGATNTLATQLGFKDLAMQLAECCCDIKKEVADVKATVLAVDAHRIRDDLHEARAELLALRSRGGGGHNGNQGNN